MCHRLNSSSLASGSSITENELILSATTQYPLVISPGIGRSQYSSDWCQSGLLQKLDYSFDVISWRSQSFLGSEKQYSWQGIKSFISPTVLVNLRPSWWGSQKAVRPSFSKIWPSKETWRPPTWRSFLKSKHKTNNRLKQRKRRQRH